MPARPPRLQRPSLQGHAADSARCQHGHRAVHRLQALGLSLYLNHLLPPSAAWSITMAAAEQLDENVMGDKVPEAKMAEILGTTIAALRSKRARNQIPLGVWNKHGSRILYSIRRYHEWLESQWVCPQEWTSTTVQSASDLCGTAAGEVKRSPIPRHSKASNQPHRLVIR